MNFSIRQERPTDYEITEDVIRQAFLDEDMSDQKEHFLVQRIRQSSAFIPELSLVAVDYDDQIIGHILLSKITIENDGRSVDSLALAPVSVLPLFQHKGIGSQLIKDVLQKAAEIGQQSVIVLGHAAYYPKFGFRQAKEWNIVAPFEVPSEIFMALELVPNALQNVQGTVRYSDAFEG
ncbi:N-acetyltransferase [Metasolibacillus meyeri]|uniref:N-acetyltransferase n=1 Tax=Metasolibacillus meyeri TaxID=1071052 RepID=A0AAW9NNE2_9BACL|nr:N-acetyltransferase [Metasolibacillus meyeri]MEC1178980.1 N-acetyltransferase [Metasolibacillus meyeri]